MEQKDYDSTTLEKTHKAKVDEVDSRKIEDKEEKKELQTDDDFLVFNKGNQAKKMKNKVEARYFGDQTRKELTDMEIKNYEENYNSDYKKNKVNFEFSKFGIRILTHFENHILNHFKKQLLMLEIPREMLDPPKVVLVYRSLQNLAHDFFHSFICAILGEDCNLGVSKKLSDYFNEKPDKQVFSHLTPDIVKFKGNEVYLIDVTITNVRNFQEGEKNQKYLQCFPYIKSKLMEPKIIILPLDKTLVNFSFLINKLSTVFLNVINNEDFNKSCSNFLSKILDKLSDLRPFLDPHLMDLVDLEMPYTSKFKEDRDYQEIQKRFEFSEELTNHVYMTQDQIEESFDKLYKDEAVYNFLKENKTSLSEIEHAKIFLQGGQNLNIVPEYKPSFHIPFCPYDDSCIPQERETGLLEQDQILSFLKFSLSHKWLQNDPIRSFVSELYSSLKKALKNPTALNLYKTGMYMSNELDEYSLKELYMTIFKIQERTRKQGLDIVMEEKGTTMRESTIYKSWKLKAESVFSKSIFPEDWVFEKSSERIIETNLPNNTKLFKTKGSVQNPNKMSYENFLEAMGCIEQQILPKVNKNKTVCLEKNHMRDNEFQKSSGVQFYKYHNERHYSSPMSCPNTTEEFDEFKTLLSEQDKHPFPLDPFWSIPPGFDSEVNFKIKETLRDDYKSYINQIRKHYCFSFAYHSHLVANQLMHFSELKTKANQYYFTTAGQPNCLYVTQGATINKNNNVGNPFFCMFITRDIRWLNHVYGEIKKIQLSDDLYLCITSWRRLSSEKLAFIRDIFYSTLSTSYSSWCRIIKDSLVPKNFRKHLEQCYINKVLVGLCTAQKLAEKLMDVRYMFMATISTYSEIGDLLKEKLSGPYQNLFVWWVCKRVPEALIELREELDKDPTKCFQFKQPVFAGRMADERVRESLGGTCNLPSLWTKGGRLQNIQDIFDEIFIYVHTMKEPSSIHYESIKAVNTILEFQTKYDKLSRQSKSGIHDVSSFKENLLKNTKMSCWVDFIYYSSRALALPLEHIKSEHKFLFSTQLEPISELTSTKACIPEITRQTEEYKLTNRQKKIFKDVEEHMKKNEKQYEPYTPKYVTLSEEIEKTFLPKTYTARHKVHDIMLDHLSRHDHKTVLDVANWNMFENFGRVIADICIKAQYGAKREFYVVNFGAKCMARIYENFFKIVGEHLENEMISVPGDKKMIPMQNLLDQVIKDSLDPKHIIMFTNGDCSKWSASETMSSFWALCDGWSVCMPPGMLQYCKAVVACWASKQIQIPNILLQNTKFITQETSYLKSKEVINSTQNFLQGMWNYSSSVKAVCCADFAIKQFKRLYPNEYLTCRHLEHSDDYLLIVRTTTMRNFENFRVIHRLSQRLHGINDSPKKTNSQPYIMEFISLMAFGGQLCYPHIKKMKEVGMNLSCVGYRNDAMSIISRVGESLRVGCTITEAYFMQLVHSLNLYTSYSLCQGLYNYNEAFNKNPFNLPLEFFGLPDSIPLVYTCTKGNPENYRLFKYGDSNVHKMLTLLVQKSELNLNTQDSSESYYSSLYNPPFVFKKTSRKIKKIREKLDLDFQNVLGFWDKNPEYMVMKPNELTKLKMWLKCQYYNSSFAMAYSQLSRSQLTLRLSFFVKKPCIEESERIYTLKSFIRYIMVCISKTKVYLPNPLLYFTLGDTNIEAFYSITETLSITDDSYNEPLVNTVAFLPESYTNLKFENPVLTVLQYCVNPVNFDLDFRRFKSIASLSRDQQMFNKEFKNVNKDNMKFILHEMFLCTTRTRVGVSYSNNSQGIDNFIINYFENGLYPNQKNIVIPGKTFSVHDPKTGSVLYQKERLYVKHLNVIAFENMVEIFIFLYKKLDIPVPEAKKILMSLKFMNTDSLAIDLLENQTYESQKQMGASTSDLQVFCFLRKLLFNDDYSIEKYMKDQNFYYFNYITFKIQKPSFFKEWATLKFRGQKSIGAYIGDQIVLISETPNYHINVLHYYIYLKLFNKIKPQQLETILTTGSNEFIKQVPVSILKKLQQETEYSAKAFTLSNTIVSMKDLNEDLTESEMVEPFIFTENLPNYLKLREEQLNLEANFDVETLSFWNGKLKLFTVPFFKLSSLNCLRMSEYKTFRNIRISNVVNSGIYKSYLHNKIPQGSIDLSSFFTGPSYKSKEDFSNFNIPLGYYLYDTDFRKSIGEMLALDVKLEDLNMSQPIRKLNFNFSSNITMTIESQAEIKEDPLFKVTEIKESKVELEEFSRPVIFSEPDSEISVTPIITEEQLNQTAEAIEENASVALLKKMNKKFEKNPVTESVLKRTSELNTLLRSLEVKDPAFKQFKAEKNSLVYKQFNRYLTHVINSEELQLIYYDWLDARGLVEDEFGTEFEILVENTNYFKFLSNFNIEDPPNFTSVFIDYIDDINSEKLFHKKMDELNVISFLKKTGFNTEANHVNYILSKLEKENEELNNTETKLIINAIKSLGKTEDTGEIILEQKTSKQEASQLVQDYTITEEMRSIGFWLNTELDIEEWLANVTSNLDYNILKEFRDLLGKETFKPEIFGTITVNKDEEYWLNSGNTKQKLKEIEDLIENPINIPDTMFLKKIKKELNQRLASIEEIENSLDTVLGSDEYVKMIEQANETQRQQEIEAIPYRRVLEEPIELETFPEWDEMIEESQENEEEGGLVEIVKPAYFIRNTYKKDTSVVDYGNAKSQVLGYLSMIYPFEYFVAKHWVSLEFKLIISDTKGFINYYLFSLKMLNRLKNLTNIDKFILQCIMKELNNIWDEIKFKGKQYYDNYIVEYNYGGQLEITRYALVEPEVAQEMKLEGCKEIMIDGIIYISRALRKDEFATFLEDIKIVDLTKTEHNVFNSHLKRLVKFCNAKLIKIKPF